MKETGVLTRHFSVASSILLSDYFRALVYTLSAKSRVKLNTTYRGLNPTVNFVCSSNFAEFGKFEDANYLEVEKWNGTQNHKIVHITIRIQSETNRKISYLHTRLSLQFLSTYQVSVSRGKLGTLCGQWPPLFLDLTHGGSLLSHQVITGALYLEGKKTATLDIIIICSHLARRRIRPSPSQPSTMDITDPLRGLKRVWYRLDASVNYWGFSIKRPRPTVITPVHCGCHFARAIYNVHKTKTAVDPSTNYSGNSTNGYFSTKARIVSSSSCVDSYTLTLIK